MGPLAGVVTGVATIGVMGGWIGGEAEMLLTGVVFACCCVGVGVLVFVVVLCELLQAASHYALLQPFYEIQDAGFPFLRA